MNRPRRSTLTGSGRDIGETLVEVLFTIVIIGVTATALISSLATASDASSIQRSSVEADYILRNYATVVKAAAQQCGTGTTYSAAYPGTLPAGYTLTPATTSGQCPATSTTLPLTLTVDGPSGFRDSLDIVIRTP